MVRKFILTVVLSSAFSLPWARLVWAAESSTNLKLQGCGSLHNAYGPYNYNTARGRAAWPVVQHYHFTESVQRLQHGSTGKIPEDLDYTLRAFPNQPLALFDMARYQLEHGYPRGANWDSVHYYPADCYFKRAIAFAPKDGVVRMIYGIYLQRKGDDKAALKRYHQAEKLIKPARTAELHYNMGLLYFQMKDYAEARKQAKLAYAKGYPLPGLRKQLKAVGQWSGSSAAESNGRDK